MALTIKGLILNTDWEPHISIKMTGLIFTEATVLTRVKILRKMRISLVSLIRMEVLILFGIPILKKLPVPTPTKLI